MHARRWLGALAVAGAFVLSAATPAAAANNRVVQISDDPFTNATSQHRTEVEPDTFSFGATWVSGFQVGRIFDGGASDIGWATTIDAGLHFVHGFLPGVTTFSQPAGPYDRASDASVAFDLRHHTWLISYLGIHDDPDGTTGVVDVLVSRSRDGIHWGMPVGVALQGNFLDKNWTVCDNSIVSPHFGNCYTEFDVASSRDLEEMSTSTDGGLTWSAGQPTADQAHGLGGQPLVQPNGRVIVPFEGVNPTRGMRAFTSGDGGATWSASVVISPITAHRVARGAVRSSPLPTAEMDLRGRAYVAWQDCQFETACPANDIVLSRSDDGTTWSPVARIPIDALGSGVEHFIPGLAVDPLSFGDHARLALTYYLFPTASCAVADCQMRVAFVTSTDAGAHWTAPQLLSDSMSLSWIAQTNQGFMVADYISTSFLVGGLLARPAFVLAAPPPAAGAFQQSVFTATEQVRAGSVATAADAVVFTPADAAGRDDVDLGEADEDEGGDDGGGDGLT